MERQMKTCSKCSATKTLAEFRKNKGTATGLHPWCKVCAKKREMSYRYNYTYSKYQEQLKKQEHRCAICRSDKTGRKDAEYFAIDHSHTTGNVRGLLCNLCNTGIGRLKTKQLLKQASEYLNIYGE